jgi:hypothetical protein
MIIETPEKSNTPMIARSESPIADRAMRKKKRDRELETHSFTLTFDHPSADMQQHLERDILQWQKIYLGI